MRHAHMAGLGLLAGITAIGAGCGESRHAAPDAARGEGHGAELSRVVASRASSSKSTPTLRFVDAPAEKAPSSQGDGAQAAPPQGGQNPPPNAPPQPSAANQPAPQQGGAQTAQGTQQGGAPQPGACPGASAYGAGLGGGQAGGVPNRFGMGIPPLGATGSSYGAGFGNQGVGAQGAPSYGAGLGGNYGGWGAGGAGGGFGAPGAWGGGAGGFGMGTGASSVRAPQFWIAEASLLTANAANTASMLAKQEPYATQNPRMLEYEAQLLNGDVRRALVALDAFQQLEESNTSLLPKIRDAAGHLAAALGDAQQTSNAIGGARLGPGFGVVTDSAASHLRAADKVIGDIAGAIGATDFQTQISPGAAQGGGAPSGNAPPQGGAAPNAPQGGNAPPSGAAPGKANEPPSVQAPPPSPTPVPSTEQPASPPPDQQH